ncbi:hypothetical protein DEU56DRAFT_813851 [Suillus clintonianus]|uniref:uncharacterized protein n=1 Tax=Suillus clintonianus TaxID=1904413 RepID=UPI001B86DB57|nr:uncharacterized protein DEU56DRAFT_813851 [Suillus clintonianus]KAG2131683.1 hypothetical protein DEU56DRAFT_813851 [Suillus clintonianus]
MHHLQAGADFISAPSPNCLFHQGHERAVDEMHALRDNTWLRFACHSKQNCVEPFKSAFLMRDKPFSLPDITQTDLSGHKFAYLFACEIAVGDTGTPDEDLLGLRV